MVQARASARLISALKRDYFLKKCGIRDRPQTPVFRNSGNWHRPAARLAPLVCAAHAAKKKYATTVALFHIWRVSWQKSLVHVVHPRLASVRPKLKKVGLWGQRHRGISLPPSIAK